MVLVELSSHVLHTVLSEYSLGAVVDEPQLVSSGIGATLYHLDTTSGEYALKLLGEAADSESTEEFEHVFEFEVHAWDAKIPMAQPIPTNAGYGVLEVSGKRSTRCRVHRWVEAVEPEADELASLTNQVGRILAHIHRLMPIGTAILDEWVRTRKGEQHWNELAERAARGRHEWAKSIAETLPLIAEVERLVAIALARSPNLVMVHGDFMSDNAPRTPKGNLVVIDWDECRPLPPEEEVAAAAVHWARGDAQGPDRESVRQLVRAYREEGGELAEVNDASFAAVLSIRTSWIEARVLQALGDAGSHPGVQAKAAQEAALAPFVVRGLLRRLPDWIAALNDA